MTGYPTDEQLERDLGQLKAPPLSSDFYPRLRARLMEPTQRRRQGRRQLAAARPLRAVSGLLAVAAVAGLLIVAMGGVHNLVSQSPPARTTSFPAKPRSWQPAPPLPAALSRPAVVAGWGRVYSLGGWAGPGKPSTAVFSLAPGSSRWVSLAPMPEARDGAVAVAAGGRIYVAGGAVYRAVARQPMLVYNPSANTWTRIAVPAPPGQQLAAAGMTLHGHPTLFFFGVLGRDGTPAPNLAYDTVTRRWSQLPDPPLWLTDTTAQTVNRTIYLFGATRPPAGQLAVPAVYAYEPSTSTFSRRASIPHRIQGAGLTSAVINGRIYVMADGAAGRRVDVYNPATNAWRSAPALVIPQTDGRLAGLGNVAYMIGGSKLIDDGNAVGPIRTVQALTVPVHR